MFKDVIFFLIVLILALQRFGKSQTQKVTSENLNCTSDEIYFSSGDEFSGEAEIRDINLHIYLGNLKSVDCSEFARECEKQTFAVSEFSKLIYLRFCNRSEMEARCYDDLQKVVNPQNSSTSWENLIRKLNFNQITNEDLTNPCLQVSMLDKALETGSRFYEIFDVIPFCDFIWCGFAEDIITTRAVSLWTCTPSK